MTQATSTALLVGSVFLNLGLSLAATVPSVACYALSGVCGAQALGSVAKVKVFDKKTKQFQNKEFNET